MWFMVQLPSPQAISEVQFDAGKEGFPLEYTVSLSTDGKSWIKVAQGKGNPGINSLSWTGTGKFFYLKMESQSKGEQPWSMKKLTLYSR